MWWFPYDISLTAEASNFKIGTHLGFAKAHHETTPRGKSERGLGLVKLLNIWGSPLIFLERPRCPLCVFYFMFSIISMDNVTQ